MLTASTSLMSLAFTIVGLAVVLAGAFAVIFVYLSKRAETTSSLQADTIDALEAAKGLAADENAKLRQELKDDREKCAGDQAKLQAQVDGLTEQVAILKELVTQKAHVEVLRAELGKGLEGVNGKLDVLIGR